MSDSSESEFATFHRAPPTSKEPEDDEGLRLQNVYSYLAEGKYPLGASKDEKRVIRKKSKKYSVSNGQLTYRTKNGNNVTVIFSEEERKRILNACHTDSTAGHLGRTKTYYKVAERYYWSGLYDDVVRLVSVIILEIIFKINCVTAMPIYLLLVGLLSYLQVTICEECQRTNTRKFDKVKPELHPIKVQSPWYH